MLILSAEQAEQIRGVTAEGHALEPIALIDGTFVLPEECLSDPAHAARRAVLEGLPVRAVSDDEYLRPHDDGPGVHGAAE